MSRLDPGAPPEYLVGHLEDALARDPRVTEQGLRVQIVGDPMTVVVTGTVVAAERKAAVTDVIGELLSGVTIRDETTVADYPEDGRVEDVT
jgi:hypothetical protein